MAVLTEPTSGRHREYVFIVGEVKKYRNSLLILLCDKYYTIMVSWYDS